MFDFLLVVSHYCFKCGHDYCPQRKPHGRYKSIIVLVSYQRWGVISKGGRTEWHGTTTANHCRTFWICGHVLSRLLFKRRHKVMTVLRQTIYSYYGAALMDNIMSTWQRRGRWWLLREYIQGIEEIRRDVRKHTQGWSQVTIHSGNRSQLTLTHDLVGLAVTLIFLFLFLLIYNSFPCFPVYCLV